MPDSAIHAEWMNIWAETRKELQKQFNSAPGIQEACRRVIEFGDDYLGMAPELMTLVEYGPGRDPDAFEGLHAALVHRLVKLYTPPGALGFVADSPLPGSRCLEPELHAGLAAAAGRSARAAQHLSELVAMIAADACNRLVTATWGPDASGPPVTSLRELCDLWVECGEQAYAQAAHREDFAAALAESLAAAIELSFEQRQLAEAWSRALDLPTRSEVDAIGERLHRLQRQILALEHKDARHGKPRR